MCNYQERALIVFYSGAVKLSNFVWHAFITASHLVAYCDFMTAFYVLKNEDNFNYLFLRTFDRLILFWWCRNERFVVLFETLVHIHTHVSFRPSDVYAIRAVIIYVWVVEPRSDTCPLPNKGPCQSFIRLWFDLVRSLRLIRRNTYFLDLSTTED